MNKFESHFQNKYKELFSAAPFSKDLWTLSEKITGKTKKEALNLINKSPSLPGNKEKNVFAGKYLEKSIDDAISSLTKEEIADGEISRVSTLFNLGKTIDTTAEEMTKMYGSSATSSLELFKSLDSLT